MGVFLKPADLNKKIKHLNKNAHTITKNGKISSHGIRQGGAIHAINSGMDWDTLMAQADWKSKKTALHYTRQAKQHRQVLTLMEVYKGQRGPKDQKNATRIRKFKATAKTTEKEEMDIHYDDDII